MKKIYVKLANLSEQKADLLATHSIDEATYNHADKMREKKKKVRQGMEF